MTSNPVSCPYCNAYVTVPAGTAAGQRVSCPRCGEAFAYRGAAVGKGTPATPASAAYAASPDTGSQPSFAGASYVTQPRWSNRAIAFLVLGVMVLMAVGGLTFAL